MVGSKEKQCQNNEEKLRVGTAVQKYRREGMAEEKAISDNEERKGRSNERKSGVKVTLVHHAEV